MALAVFLLFLHVASIRGYINPYPEKTGNSNNDGDPGMPLFLTPYIESGKIEEARNLSRVHFPGFPKIKSYAGFFTVDKEYDSNQFLWYFPPEQEQEGKLKSALYLWLQGGPGESSLFGLFNENGPFKVVNGKFGLRDSAASWTSHDHVIYIDNPVGAGFSFTSNSRGYCTNQTQIGEHLYTTLTQFFQLFPELQKYNFIISGESYAGKYIPALGYTIHKKNPTAKVKINLKGMMIGNGWSDPINQLDYSDYLYHLGFLDWNAKRTVESLQNETVELIKKAAWYEAALSCDKLYKYISIYLQNISFYNYKEILESTEEDDYSILIQAAANRKAIHVGNLTYGHSGLVYEALKEDIMQSVTSWISELLEHYHMLFYNGQVDIIVAYPLTVNFLRKLKFSGREHYLNAGRKAIMITYPSGEVTVQSYLTAGGNLTDAVIRNAGHMVPADQPEFMKELMTVWRANANI